MPDVHARVAENLSKIQARIAEAAARSGRSGDEVLLVAVTKYVDAPRARALVAAGCRQLGESRPQELWQKADELTDADVAWHLVGHLQRNKIRRTLPLVALVHSVDSLRLASAIDEAAAEFGRRAPVLLEVNTSGDAAKHGFAPDELATLLAQLASHRHVEVRGLMTMASREGGLDEARKNFSRLRELRQRLRNIRRGTAVAPGYGSA